MNSWPHKRLSEITHLITDGKHGDCDDQSGSGYFFLSSKDLRDGKLNYDEPREITHAGFLETHRRTNLEPGDILLTNCGASIGRVGIAQDDPRIRKTTFQKSVSVVKPDRSVVDGTYLYYFLLRNSALLIRLGGGTAQPNLLIGDLKRISVPIPPIAVQRRIAGILSAYDRLVDNNRRRIRTLEVVAHAIYVEWFVHFRFPGHENHPCVGSPLGDIPKGWQICCVRDVAGLVSRGPSLSYVSESGHPVLNQRCVRNGELELQALQFAAPLSAKKAHLYLKPNDILINSMGVGTLGRVSRNLSVTEAMIIHNCITVVRPKAQEPSGAFLYYRLSDCEARFESLGVGATGQTSLRIEAIEDVQFVCPPQDLLRRFDEAVQPAWKQIGALKRQIANLRRTRDLLLPRLLSGQVDVEAA